MRLHDPGDGRTLNAIPGPISGRREAAGSLLRGSEPPVEAGLRLAEAAGSRGRRRRALAWACAGGALLAVCAGCSISQLINEAHDVESPAVSGSVEMHGPNLGEHTLAPLQCRSGDRFHFFGVDLADDRQGLTLRLIEDPALGPEIRVFSREQAGTGGGVLYRPALCRTLERRLEHTGWRINEIRDVSGSLEVDCVTGGGDSIAGKIEFSHCH